MIVSKFKTSILLALVIFFSHGLVAAPKDQVISQQKAIAVVIDNFGGKMLKVKLIKKPHASFYKVKLLTKNGRVKQVRVDSRTGEVLNTSRSK